VTPNTVKRFLRQIWRFLLVGGSNTAVTGLCLWLLAAVIDPQVAYSIVFAGGIIYSTALTSRYVFSAATSPLRMAAYVLWYLGVYGVGLVIVRMMDHNGRSHLVLALVTVAITAPLSFIGGLLIFGRVPANAAASAREGKG
jgi:putative flippase GtrA